MNFLETIFKDIKVRNETLRSVDKIYLQTRIKNFYLSLLETFDSSYFNYFNKKPDIC